MRDSTSVISLAAGIALGIGAFSFLASTQSSFNPSDAGLGPNTVSRIASLDGLRINSVGYSLADVAVAMRSFRERRSPVALWLGASQLHAINHYVPGDALAVDHANRSARDRGAAQTYVQVSLANANFHEFLTEFLALRRRGVTPTSLVVAALYDDLRDAGIRDSVLIDLGDLPDSVLARGGTGIQNIAVALREARVASESQHSPIGVSAMGGTPQQRLESGLMRRMDEHWDAYRDRGRLLAKTQVMLRALIARAMGGMMSRRASPVPPDVQQWNMAAFDDLIRVARTDGIRLLIYKPPHRPGEKIFYHDRTAYDEWHRMIRQRCEREGIGYLDLETLVPGDLYGLTNEGRPDVFHFQGAGHRLLGAAIDNYFAQTER